MEDNLSSNSLTDLMLMKNEGPSEVMYPYIFPPYTHVIVGSYLIVVGILGTLGNGLLLITFLRYRVLVTPTSLLLINLAASDLGMILFGFPFSASSSLSGRWLFGDGGCQWYAFMGFLFGSAHIGTLALLALDRYLIDCRFNLSKNMVMLYLAALTMLTTDVSEGIRKVQGGKLTYKRYTQMLAAAWGYAFFWSMMPVLGWGRYGPEPSITTCTIDWQHNDSSYKSFIIVYFVLGFLVPFAIISVCYCAIIRRVRRKAKERPIARDQWTNEASVTLMSFILIVAFVIAWSPYAVLCLWTIFAPPRTVPPFLTLIPPLFAKTSTVFNPIIYFLTNPKLRTAILSTINCCEKPPLQNIELPDSPERAATADAI